MSLAPLNRETMTFWMLLQSELYKCNHSKLHHSDVPTKMGRTVTGARVQFWSDDLPVATDDSYGYSIV